ncbi:DsrE family protein [Enterococcus nangangensis]
MKVVFHVDEVEKFAEASKNIRNLFDSQPDIEIILVVNGSGIQSYELQSARNFIAQYPGVSFHACNNAMKAFHLAKKDLPQGVEVVPAGVLDLIQLQEQGCAYIKP